MLLKSVLASLALAASSSFEQVSAFTNGTLLPSYMCGPPTDGLPKSLGGVLPYFVLNTNPKFVAQPNGDGKLIAPERPLDNAFGGRLNNTQFLLAGFHNSANGITAGKFVVSASILATNDPKFGTPNFVPIQDQVYPGREHTVTLTANTVDNANTPSDAGIALDGAVVYTTYSAQGSTVVNRISGFVTAGPMAQVWAACGPYNAGVVHNQLLSCTNTYNGYVWRAPADLQPGGTVTFKGAAVTDLNYGAHTSTFLVANPNMGAPSLPPQITKIVLLANKQAQIYFVDPNRGSQIGMATTSFKVTYSLSAGMPANTIGTNNIAAANAPATLTAVNTTVTIMNTGNGSPVTIDFTTALRTAGVAAAYMTVSMVNSINGQADSKASNAVSFAVGATLKITPSQAEVLIAGNYQTSQLPPSTLNPAGSYPFTSLCDTNAYNAALLLNFLPGTGTDPDNSCTQFNAMTTAALAATGGSGTVVTGAAPSNPPTFFTSIINVAAATLAAFKLW